MLHFLFIPLATLLCSLLEEKHFRGIVFSLAWYGCSHTLFGMSIIPFWLLDFQKCPPSHCSYADQHISSTAVAGYAQLHSDWPHVPQSFLKHRHGTYNISQKARPLPSTLHVISVPKKIKIQWHHVRNT